MRRRHKGKKSRDGGENGKMGGEYWKGRPGSTDPGKETKKLTHRIERARRKAETRRMQKGM